MRAIGGATRQGPLRRPAPALLALGLAAAVACQAAQTPGPQTSPSASVVAASPTASPAASPTPSYPIREGTCAMRVSQSFTLANDMTCTGDGMVVVSDNITVDLGGHTLTGPGMGPQTWPQPQLDSVGIRTGGHTGVTIRNGKTIAFSTGIYFVDMASSTIESVTTQRNRYGFYIHASKNITVKGSDVQQNIYGLHLQSSHDSVLQGNLLARQTYNSPGGYGLYMYASTGNRILENTIDTNVNWGVWFSDARDNVIFHNNIVGNSPPAADNTESNVWYDKATKEGNWWADYKGRDGDNDLIGDTPYAILGAGGNVDPYPFVDKDGWTKKRRSTIDHYDPAAPRPPRAVTVLALAGGAAYSARPTDDRATLRVPNVSQIALGTDERTLYTASGKTVTARDIVTGATGDQSVYAVDGIIAANRDGHSVLVVGPLGAEQRDLTTGRTEFFRYRGTPSAVAPSYKHNHIFVATPRGIDLLYLNLGGRTPYTIPLDGTPAAMVMAGSGTRIYVAIAGQGLIDVVDTEQYAVVDRIAIDVNATSLAISPREDILYLGSASGVRAVRIRDRSTVSSAAFLGSVVDLAVSPNGDQIYVALAGVSHGIAVLDAPRLRVAHVIELDNDPSRILVASY
jgi:parallel beta-helix repeat protein